MLFPLKRMYWRARSQLRDFVRENFVDCLKTSNVRGLHINILVSNDIEAYRVSTYATKEPETLDWIDSEMRPADVFLDIGANIGLYSIYAAKRHPGLKVFSVEPDAMNFSRLMKNMTANRLGENLIPLNIAVSNKTQLGFLYLSRLEAGAALHSLDGSSNKSVKEGIYCLTLDELCLNHELPFPNHIKIDVDGLEDQILLEGAKSCLQRQDLRSILVELDESNATKEAEVHHFLESHGFRCREKVYTDVKKTISNRVYKRMTQ